MAAGGTERNRRRRVAALLMLGVTLLLAAFVYVVGLFSDWSGQHRVPMGTTIAAAAVVIVGSIVSVWILRTHR